MTANTNMPRNGVSTAIKTSFNRAVYLITPIFSASRLMKIVCDCGVTAGGIVF